MMEYLNWAGEHPFLTAFFVWMAAWAIGSLGRIGSTRIVNNKSSKDDDE